MWIRDIQHVLRQLRRSPAFTATVVGTIGLALAANALVFTILHAAVLRPLPYQDERQLLVAAPLAPGVVLEWRSRATSFTSFSAFLVWDLDVIGFERPERVSAAVVTPEFFTTLGARARVGRVFTTTDGRDGAPVAILSEGYARRHFGAESAALGRTLRIDGRSCAVVGVMGAGVRFPTVVDLWIPARQKVPEYPLDPQADVTTNHGSHYLGSEKVQRVCPLRAGHQRAGGGAPPPRVPRPRPAGAGGFPPAITASAPAGMARETTMWSPRSIRVLFSAVIAGHRGNVPPLGSPFFTKLATYDESCSASRRSTFENVRPGERCSVLNSYGTSEVWNAPYRADSGPGST
jgi:hypothetical protein